MLTNEPIDILPVTPETISWVKMSGSTMVKMESRRGLQKVLRGKADVPGTSASKDAEPVNCGTCSRYVPNSVQPAICY
jgi:hypothetical protein